MPAIRFQEPHDSQINIEILDAFEQQLNLHNPERGLIGCRVLGYGEISTVLELLEPGFAGWALKRMSIFRDMGEIEAYIPSYSEYNGLLEQRIGIELPAHGFAVLQDRTGRPIFYIIQRKVAAGSIGNQILHTRSEKTVLMVFHEILAHIGKLAAFNKKSRSQKIALDAQISNWAVSENSFAGLDDAASVSLMYLDTSTPLYQLNGVEQLNPELFLRAAPSYLTWILRRFFLEDVMTRYYDPFNTVLDLIANFYKEGRAELIPRLVDKANTFFDQELGNAVEQPLTEAAVRRYYREDALLWSLYASMRRMDRFLRERLLGRPYPYILPGEVQR